MEGNFLSQVLSELDRKDDLLVLLFVNTEGLRDVMVGGCLGRSDHEMVEFRDFGVTRQKVSRVTILDFKKANLKLLSSSKLKLS